MISRFEPVVRFINCYDGNLSRAALALGVANSTLTEWRNHERPVPVKKAVLMEQLSGGAVKRMEFFPEDGSEIWPELATPTHPRADLALQTQGA